MAQWVEKMNLITNYSSSIETFITESHYFFLNECGGGGGGGGSGSGSGYGYNNGYGYGNNNGDGNGDGDDNGNSNRNGNYFYEANISLTSFQVLLTK